MATNKLTIQKGNPYNGTITVTDSAGVAYDLTGKTIFFTVKKQDNEDTDDTNAVITKDITVHTDPTHGITVLALTAIQTNIVEGDYKYDLRIYKSVPLTQLNSISGICEVTKIVTKRIA
jgi:hypothetical protein